MKWIRGRHAWNIIAPTSNTIIGCYICIRYVFIGAASMAQKKWTMLICATRAWRLSSKVHKDRDIKILFRCATVHGFSCTSRITHAASGFFERTPPSSIFQRCKSRKKLKMTSFKVNLVYCSATFSFRPPQRIERFTRVCIDRYNKRK